MQIESRTFTNKLLEMISEGVISADTVLLMCVKWMSEDDVKDMMRANELID